MTKRWSLTVASPPGITVLRVASKPRRRRRDALGSRSLYPDRHGDRRHRRDVPNRRHRQVIQCPGRRRPVGAVVRPVPHARADHREGGRRHRGQSRARQGQRRREPADLAGRSRSSRSRPCTPCATARSSTASSAPCPNARSSGSSRRCSRPRSRRTLASLIAAGDEASLRKAIELDPGNEDAIVALASLLVGRSAVRRSAGPARAHPRVRAHQADRRRRPARRAAGGGAPSDDYDAKLDRAAAPGQGRRRGPPAVRRHPRADGPGRSPHRRLPQELSRRAVLASPSLARFASDRLERVRPGMSRRHRHPPDRRHRCGGAESRRHEWSPLAHDDVDVSTIPMPGRLSLRAAIPDARRSFRGCASSARGGSSERPGSVLVLAGVAWWLLRSPVVPTEASATPRPACRSRHSGGREVTRRPGAAPDVGDVDDRPSWFMSRGQSRCPASTNYEPASASPTPSTPAEGRWPMPIPRPSTSLPRGRWRPHRRPVLGEIFDGPVTAAAPPRRGDAGRPGEPHRRQHGRCRRVRDAARDRSGHCGRHRRASRATRTVRQVDDLEAVQGIGPAKIEAIRDHSRCDGLGAATAVRGRGSRLEPARAASTPTHTPIASQRYARQNSVNDAIGLRVAMRAQRPRREPQDHGDGDADRIHRGAGERHPDDEQSRRSTDAEDQSSPSARPTVEQPEHGDGQQSEQRGHDEAENGPHCRIRARYHCGPS